MGYIIQAKCSCGYETKDLYFGAGMTDFMRVAMVPAIKNGSTQIEMININQRSKFPDYIFYTDNELSEMKGGEATIEHFDLKLQPENNYCPACKNFKLQFLSLGCFD